jgi:hypothetical protein
VAKASPGIRFNEHIEGEGETVFRHACGDGLGVEAQEAQQRPSIQNNSGLPQGLAGRCVAG